MEKRREIKHPPDENDEDGESFSSSPIRQCLPLDEDEGPRSRSKEESEESRVNDFPRKMLMEILKCVETRHVFTCRLVNRHWCFVSSQLLFSHGRRDAEVEFQFENKQGFTSYTGAGQVGGIQDFVTCFKASRNWDWPYARLKIVDYNFGRPFSQLFDHEDWIQFLSQYDVSTIKSLNLFSCNLHKKDTQEILMEEMRDLLLNKIPHLEELDLFLRKIKEAGFKSEAETAAKSESESESDPESEIPEINSFPRLSQDKVWELPHLKVIHLNDSMFSLYPQMSKDLLVAAVNLKQIHLDRIFSAEAFELLHSLRKLHLVQEAEIQLDQRFLSTVKKYKKYGDPPFTFKLKELKLKTADIFERRNSNSNSNSNSRKNATRFLSHLFKNLKDSLIKLNIEPLGALHGLEFSRFKNLKELTLKQGCWSFEPFFPAQVRNLDFDIFPAVNRLDLEFVENWRAGFPTEDSIPRLPSLKILSVMSTDRKMNKAIAILALLCPNLKDFKIKGDAKSNSPSQNCFLLCRAIWTLMTQLESLEIDIDIDIDVDVDSPEKNPFAFDSCFTGMSVETCRRLYKMMEAKETLEKYGVPVEIPQSMLTVEREYPSILNMKDLRKLTVNTCEPAGEQDNFNKWTWISEEYAFKLMNHIEIYRVNRR